LCFINNSFGYHSWPTLIADYFCMLSIIHHQPCGRKANRRSGLHWLCVTDNSGILRPWTFSNAPLTYAQRMHNVLRLLNAGNRCDELRLMKRLFRYYDSTVRPRRNSSQTVSVEVLFSLQQINDLVRRQSISRVCLRDKPIFCFWLLEQSSSKLLAAQRQRSRNACGPVLLSVCTESCGSVTMKFPR